MLASTPLPDFGSCRWVRTEASSQPRPTRILIALPTWPARAIDGSSSSAHSCNRGRSKATSEDEPAMSRITPIGSAALP